VPDVPLFYFISRLKVFENRVLRMIFGSKRGEVTGRWRKLHSEKLHYLYRLPNITRAIKLRKMRWAGHVAQDRFIHGFGGET